MTSVAAVTAVAAVAAAAAAAAAAVAAPPLLVVPHPPLPRVDGAMDEARRCIAAP